MRLKINISKYYIDLMIVFEIEIVKINVDLRYCTVIVIRYRHKYISWRALIFIIFKVIFTLHYI